MGAKGGELCCNFSWKRHRYLIQPPLIRLYLKTLLTPVTVIYLSTKYPPTRMKLIQLGTCKKTNAVLKHY